MHKTIIYVRNFLRLPSVSSCGGGWRHNVTGTRRTRPWAWSCLKPLPLSGLRWILGWQMNYVGRLGDAFRGSVCARFINQFRGLCFARKKIPPMVLLRADEDSRVQQGRRREGKSLLLKLPIQTAGSMVLYSLQLHYFQLLPARPTIGGHGARVKSRRQR